MKRSAEFLETNPPPTKKPQDVKMGFHPSTPSQITQHYTTLSTPPIFDNCRKGSCSSLEFHLHATSEFGNTNTEESIPNLKSGLARAGTVHLRQVYDLAISRHPTLSSSSSSSSSHFPTPSSYATSWGVPTPIFMPVGTKGAVKATTVLEMLGEGTISPNTGISAHPGLTSSTTTPPIPICLANTYHLLNAPTPEVVSKLGGLHKMEGYNGGMLTDSGGFQMVSLGDLCTIDENGVTFDNPYAVEPTSTSTPTPTPTVEPTTTTTTTTNHYRQVSLRPEDSIYSQNLLGADIIMCLDDVCSSLTPIDDPRLQEATERTVRWLDRCQNAHGRRSDQSLFPIVQGGLDVRPGGLRDYCLTEFGRREDSANDPESSSSSSSSDNSFHSSPGFAIGGLSGGESKDLFWRVVHHCCKALPPLKPRYLMGVGYPVDVVVCVALGVDMFDCVYPTRTARFGVALTDKGGVSLKKCESKNFNEEKFIDDNCNCDACNSGGYTRKRLNDMLSGPTEEPGGSHTLAIQLITAHNLSYMMSLVRRMRDAILAGENKFETFVKNFMKTRYPAGVKKKETGEVEKVETENSEFIPTWVIEALGAVNIVIN